MHDGRSRAQENGHARRLPPGKVLHGHLPRRRPAAEALRAHLRRGAGPEGNAHDRYPPRRVSGARQDHVRGYAKDWIDTYTRRTSRGFRESTRDGYRYSLEERAIPFFSKRTPTLASISPPDVRAFIVSLFARQVADKPPAVSTVRGHVAALKVLLATAVEDGLIRHNPASGVRIARPGAPVLEKDGAQQRRALDSGELARFLRKCPAEWELFFRLLAMTGVRIGEAVELRWKDVDFGAKRLQVRRSLYQGVVAEPKSKHGKRDIPLSTVLAQQL